MISKISRRTGLGFAGILLALVAIVVAISVHIRQATEIRVMSSAGFSPALRELLPKFEKATGCEVRASFGASMGTTADAIPIRIARGERVDVVVMVGTALDDLVKQGRIIPDSRVEIARSRIGVAVRAGEPKPDIGSIDAVRRALLAARSIAYSDSASGVYISTELYRRLGIADQVAGKSKKIEGEPVAAAVARGDAEIGFQQISEIIPVPGADYVGPLPPELQKITVYAAGVAVEAQDPDGARALTRFLASPEAAPAVVASRLEPIIR